MKRRILFLLMLLLALSGCSAEPAPRETGFGWALKDQYREQGIEMDDFADNPEYEYIKWAYDGWYSFYPTREEREQGIQPESWVNDWNLTHTAQSTRGTSSIRGCQVLTSIEEYNAVLDAINDTRTAALENCGAYGDPEEIQRTWEGSFDEEFFSKHDLILVDYCCEGNTYVRSRLDEVERDGLGRVTVRLSWETVHATTASQPGEVYWIVLPKGCTDLTVEYTETAWN